MCSCDRRQPSLLPMPHGCVCVGAGGRPLATQRQALRRGLDMVVGTPGRLSHLLSTGALDLSACHTMVLDEADVLLGDAAAFAEQVLQNFCLLHGTGPVCAKIAVSLPGHPCLLHLYLLLSQTWVALATWTHV